MATKRLMPATASIPAQRVRTDLAAEVLGLKGRTLEKWRVLGFGPPYLKLGRIVVYDLRELERWAASRARSSTSDTGPPRRAA